MIIPTLTALAIAITLILAVLFLAGQLITRRMRAVAATGADAPAHRLLNDLRGLEDALVDFFASSNISSTILSVLAAQRSPIRFKSLVQEVRAAEERRGTHEDMPLSAIRAVLTILQLARLARMSRAGFSITELGGEVYRRMQPEPLPTATPPVRKHPISAAAFGKHRRTPAILPSHSRRVLSELRERARTLVHQ